LTEATIVSAGATVSTHGDDFRTATQLVAANLGVALLPTLALVGVSTAVTAGSSASRHFRERPAVRLTT